MPRSSEDASPHVAVVLDVQRRAESRRRRSQHIQPPSVFCCSLDLHVRLCRCPRVGCDTPQEKLGRDLPLAPSCAVCHLAAVYITGNTGTTLLLSKAASLSSQRYLEGEKQSERQPLLFCFCQALKTLGKQKPDGLRAV